MIDKTVEAKRFYFKVDEFERAFLIYGFVENAGMKGLNIEQICDQTGLSKHLCRKFLNVLELEGCLKKFHVHSDKVNRIRHYLYVAVYPPVYLPTDRDKLDEIASLLLKISGRPDSWDKSYKAKIHYTIKKCLGITSR